MKPLFAIAVAALVVGCQGDGLFRRGEEARGQSFGPFRSKSARLDLTPQSAAKPTQKDVLLVATVYDPDGGTLGRRPIEWTIEGPGEFVAVDAGGWFSGRGKKTGGKFATTHTHTFESKLEKKTFSSSSDEPVIKHGQSWVVVSSAVEGRTVVTAVCPEIADRDKGRVTANLIWADSEFSFPSTMVAPAGGESRLKTDLARLASPAGYRVRYRILGGAAASLAFGGEGVTSLTGGNTQDLTTNATGDGSAEVKLVQAVPAAGTTRVAVEVIKPDPNGIGPGTVVAKHETAVEWAIPQLSLDFKGPATVGENRESTYAIVVANGGKADSQPVTLRATLPPSVALVQSDPPASVQQGRERAWVLPAVKPGERREVKLTIKPARKGPFDLIAVAQTPDGARAEQKVTATADAASFAVAIDAPAFAPIRDTVTVPIRIANTGAVPIERATLWLTGSDGLAIARRETTEPVDFAVGAIDPGKTAIVDVPVRAERSGRYSLKATLTADGGLTERAEAAIDARTMGWKLTLNGPDRVGLGEPAAYAIEIVNPGEMAVGDLLIKAELPRGLNAVRADHGTVSDAGGYATWRIASLNAGETKRLTLATTGDRTGPAAKLKVTATSAAVAGKSLEQSAEVMVQVAGLPAVELDLQGPGGTVAVGGRATYRVTVRNRGTGAARDVAIAVDLPSELAGLTGRSAIGAGSVAESRITFPVIANLSPGQAVTVYADVEATHAGSARVRATASGPDLPNPVREEQATRIAGR